MQGLPGRRLLLYVLKKVPDDIGFLHDMIVSNSSDALPLLMSWCQL